MLRIQIQTKNTVLKYLWWSLFWSRLPIIDFHRQRQSTIGLLYFKKIFILVPNINVYKKLNVSVIFKETKLLLNTFIFNNQLKKIKIKKCFVLHKKNT